MRIRLKSKKKHEQKLEINLYLMAQLSEYQMILSCLCQMIEIRNSYATC